MTHKKLFTDLSRCYLRGRLRHGGKKETPMSETVEAATRIQLIGNGAVMRHILNLELPQSVINGLDFLAQTVVSVT
jgi:hypothetical protein